MRPTSGSTGGPLGRKAFDFDRVDFVTADTHFGHARIIELAERPFANVEEMDTEMVRRWNSVIGPSDIVLHLGDLALGPVEHALDITRQLNGHRLLVPGNHDRVSSVRQSKTAIARFAPLYQEAGWEILPETLHGFRGPYELQASHYPYASDSSDGRSHRGHTTDDGLPLIHGHTHARDHGPHGHQFHVGVDAADFTPIPVGIIVDWLSALVGRSPM